ncbi:HU family DNA-binding protein, partial [Neobacillus cucumis]|uniref:HU family DNA-binding protein n=1 Tax=Neobacillus cucumis TaxID=1740721 RepID=UPI0036196097
FTPPSLSLPLFAAMAPKAMKAMKKAAVSITKSGLADALATATELKKSECSKVLTSLSEIVAKEVKKTGKVTIPGVAMVKTRLKPATKAGKREVFGKVVMVKAKPARTIVKAYPVAALKKAV